MFESVLETILTAPGAIGTALLDVQGEVVAHAGDAAAVELLGAYQSVWLGEVGRAARRAGLGEVRDLALDFADRRVLSAEVKDGYFILVVLDAQGLASVARERLQRARERIAQEI